MRYTRKNIKGGMWIFLGNQVLQGDQIPFLESRAKMFDYRNTPLNAKELVWHSQSKNPYKLTPNQITRVSPLTCKFKAMSGEYITHTFRLQDVTHAFNTHSEFIAWRNEFLATERDTIRDLHQTIRKDRKFWKTRRAELKTWNRVDDEKRIRRIK
tara:strand:- start:2280 stop:2744 length:465 start_codon:yes stop_codon:yes gene_type:complete